VSRNSSSLTSPKSHAKAQRESGSTDSPLSLVSDRESENRQTPHRLGIRPTLTQRQPASRRFRTCGAFQEGDRARADRASPRTRFEPRNSRCLCTRLAAMRSRRRHMTERAGSSRILRAEPTAAGVKGRYASLGRRPFAESPNIAKSFPSLPTLLIVVEHRVNYSRPGLGSDSRNPSTGPGSSDTGSHFKDLLMLLSFLESLDFFERISGRFAVTKRPRR
jgi:hypothetical protein